MVKIDCDGGSVVINKDPYKENSSNGLDRFVKYLEMSISVLENGKQFDPTYLAHSAIFSSFYISLCRKEDKKSIPKKLERIIKNSILNRHGTLVEVYKDIVNLYYSV